MTQQLEAKFVNQWLLMNHPDSLQWRRVRLGPLPTVDLSRMFMVTQNWIDAIVKKESEVLLIEAKLRNESAGIGQLLLYDSLFRQTPEFTELHEYPRKLILLCYRNIPAVREAVKQYDIEYVVFQPQWLIDALEKR